MPIRPENKSRYPKDWKQIRERILTRAGQERNKAGWVMGEAKCEWCGVLNHAYGYRDKAGTFHNLSLAEAEAAHLDGEKVLQIVLTIAHVNDPSPENCADDNLAALCQRCHLNHDREHHNQVRAENRRRREPTGELFGGPA